jgi:hypothetical protein
MDGLQKSLPFAPWVGRVSLLHALYHHTTQPKHPQLTFLQLPSSLSP